MGCNNPISGKVYMTCFKCKKHFDLACAGVQPNRFQTMSPSKKLKWTCSVCRESIPKANNIPMRPETSSTLESVAQKSSSPSIMKGPGKQSPSATNNEEKSDLGVGTVFGIDDISKIIAKEVTAAIRTELPKILNQMLEVKLTPIKEQLDNLQSSVSFMSQEYDRFNQKVDAVSSENRELQKESKELQTTVSSMTERLNHLEQCLRECNIEIQGVPEHKTENVVNIVMQIAQVVNHKILDTDILNCTRVASMNRDSKKPRAIIAKLRSKRCRDEFYSAVTKFNKANSDNKLNSSLLGIAGEKLPVYVSEHLSPANKALHAATRIKAKEKNYKFVWVRNGRIFMRKDETSPFVHVKNELVLNKLVG